MTADFLSHGDSSFSATNPRAKAWLEEQRKHMWTLRHTRYAAGTIRLGDWRAAERFERLLTMEGWVVEKEPVLAR